MRRWRASKESLGQGGRINRRIKGAGDVQVEGMGMEERKLGRLMEDNTPELHVRLRVRIYVLETG